MHQTAGNFAPVSGQTFFSYHTPRPSLDLPPLDPAVHIRVRLLPAGSPATRHTASPRSGLALRDRIRFDDVRAVTHDAPRDEGDEDGDRDDLDDGERGRFLVGNEEVQEPDHEREREDHKTPKDHQGAALEEDIGVLREDTYGSLRENIEPDESARRGAVDGSATILYMV